MIVLMICVLLPEGVIYVRLLRLSKWGKVKKDPVFVAEKLYCPIYQCQIRCIFD